MQDIKDVDPNEVIENIRSIFVKSMFKELNSETNADFFYHDPKTFKVKGGFGKVPLPWGEYPEGMVKNTKESNEYDLNRGRIYPLPHEIFEGRSLANVASQEQGTELNDPHFITASRLLHSYLNNSKSELVASGRCSISYRPKRNRS